MSVVANTIMLSQNNLAKKRKNITTGENEECNKKQKTEIGNISSMTDIEVETVMSGVLRDIVNKWEKEFKLSNYVGKDQPPLPTEFRREGVIASQKSLVKEWQKKIDSYKKKMGL